MRVQRVLVVLVCGVLSGCAMSKAESPMRAALTDPSAVGGPAPEAADRMIARSASLEIERSDPEAGPTAAVALAKAQGGWVRRSSTQGASLMVPAAQLDSTLTQLGALGDVTGRYVSGEDVTDEYRDVTIRLDNLEKSRVRYLALLDRAATVADAAAVERELERVTLALERMKGRIQALGQSVKYSSVEVNFSRPIRPGPVGWVFYGLYHGVKWLLVWD
jgi:hypothetical protein